MIGSKANHRHNNMVDPGHNITKKCRTWDWNWIAAYCTHKMKYRSRLEKWRVRVTRSNIGQKKYLCCAGRNRLPTQIVESNFKRYEKINDNLWGGFGALIYPTCRIGTFSLFVIGFVWFFDPTFFFFLNFTFSTKWDIIIRLTSIFFQDY